MPGRLCLTTPIQTVADQLGLTIVGTHADHPRLDAAPGENLPVLAPGQKLVPMRWGVIPTGKKNARGRPVLETLINARSETVFSKTAFEGLSRCIVVADGWYEWTGPVRKKTRWRLQKKTGDVCLFAAIFDTWSGPGEIEVPQVATLTCRPNAEVEQIHHRMGVILDPVMITAWMAGETIALDPPPDGTIDIEEVPDPPL